MPAYLNRHGRSGVTWYDVGPDYIDVTFVRGRTYRYSHRNAGLTVVNQMARLAAAGRGLATWISRNKPPYD